MNQRIPEFLRSLARKPIIRFLGSLKLAMLLLSILIAGCIVGTVTESRLDTVVAQAYIYDAPWFAAWLTLLCTNLVCSVLVRYPWKPRQLGFIITHAGIVILLGGAMIGRLWGVEGNVTLATGQPSHNSLVVNRTVVELQTPGALAPLSHAIDTRLHPPSPTHPQQWTVGKLTARVSEYSEQLVARTMIQETPRQGPAAIEILLTSAMMSTPFDAWLVLGDPAHDSYSFGPAVLRLLKDDEGCDSAQHADSGCCAHPDQSAKSNALSGTGLNFYYQTGGKLRFVSFSKGQQRASGDLVVGRALPTGLADWKFEVRRVLSHATVREELAPAGSADSSASVLTGVLLQLETGGQRAQQWIAANSPARFSLGEGNSILAAFGYQVLPLGFEVALDKFEVERNEGTQTPAGFKSNVRFTDIARKTTVHRQVWMNHPATFPEFPGASLVGTSYKFSQASWNPDDLTQTTLQVVRDPGWSLKWIGSLLVCAGLFFMFCFTPSRALQKPLPTGNNPARPVSLAAQAPRGRLGRALTLSVLSIILVPAAFATDLDFSEAARIVVQAGGRKKPLETFAAESLQSISGRRVLTDLDTGSRTEALDVLFSMWFGTRAWQKTPLVLVSSAELRQQLGLSKTQRLFSFETLVASQHLSQLYQTVRSKRARKEELSPIEKQAEIVISRVETLGDIASLEALAIVPRPDGMGAWVSPINSAALSKTTSANMLAPTFQRVIESYRARDAVRFKQATRELRSLLATLSPARYPTAGVIEREVRYNHLHPFRSAWLLYLAGFMVLLCLGLNRGPIARTLALGLFGAGVLIHVYGFVLRCQIAGYAPVTNMYESVVWVSLGIAGFALAFSLVYKARVYLLAAAPLAIAGLILADMLPSVLDPKIGPLPPVLRDNFWLATHVLTITLGYAAFALAMGLAHWILAQGLFAGKGADEKSPYHYLLYRVLQVGVLLLAAGTILGGVWANYAWGRFWGWDPKETWALIALLLYIFALHGRLAGWWGNYGLSVAAAICFNGVLMAWYGVNFVLGKGLHSYGFGGGGLQWIGSLVALDLLFVAFCVFLKLRQAPALKALRSVPTVPSVPSESV
jgi:cytochrome c-type biogenesis protein CcsB